MRNFSSPSPSQRISSSHRAALSASAGASYGIYLGHDAGRWHFVPPEQSVMVLGPPRSGKTTAVIIPNVLAAAGPVVSTSTKPDVLDATLGARSAVGRCLLFDPTSSVTRVHGLERLRWSPLQSCGSWLGSLATARSLVDVGTGAGTGRGRHGESSHWTERAQALLAPLLHAAALDGADMGTVLTWVDRHQALPAQQVLAGTGHSATSLARNLLDGIVTTDERELSGIWSTASGALAGFRSEQVLEATTAPDFDAGAFVRSADTLYIAAPSHRQALVAPLVVGLIEDVRQATYALAAETEGRGPIRPPVLLALDEVANIAPLPELPSMISEGGGQGLVTLACLQDLSQARHRWPDHADGFPSLFGSTVVLPGIGDVRTLQALSTLAGDEEVPIRTVSVGRNPTGHPFADLITGGRPHLGESATTQRRPRLPADAIARGVAGHVLVFDRRNQPDWIPTAASHLAEPWRTLRSWSRLLDQHGPARRLPPPGLDLGHGR
jgi:type IV secretory pathway TraG/TraD family ATPase VirD4